MKLTTVEKVALILLFLVFGFCCSRTTDTTSLRTSEFKGSDVLHVDANGEGGVKETTVGSWDGMRFADDVVLQPDGGLASVDGGLPRVVSAEHHDDKRELEAWQKASMGSDEHTDLTGTSSEATRKETDTELLSGPLKWLGLLALVAGGLFVLYRFRKAIPWLRWLP